MSYVTEMRPVVMLSSLLRCHLIDTTGQRARLTDLAVALSEDATAPVVTLGCQPSLGHLAQLPWSVVQHLDLEQHQITIPTFDPSDVRTPEPPVNTVWLRREMLDALVLDIRWRRVAMANDLELELTNGTLALRGVDTSIWGIVRRLTAGRIDRDPGTACYAWATVEFLRGDPKAAEAGASYHRQITRLPPGELARLADALPYLHVAELVTLLPDELAADTLESMSPERQLQVFEELDETRAIRLLALMAPEEAADLIGHLTPLLVQMYLERLPSARRQMVIELLRYPEDSAGGIMTNELVTISARVTVATAQEQIRTRLIGPELAYYVYVIDDDDQQQLRGVLTLRDLLVADPEQWVADIMDPYLVTIHPLEPADAAAQRVLDNQLFALPVVGAAGRLLGAVTVDAAVAQVAPTRWRQQAPKVFS